MKRIIIISVLMLTSMMVWAENSFMGRRVIIQVDGAISPNSYWLSLVDDYKAKDAFINAPYFTVTPKIECIVWQKGSIWIDYTPFYQINKKPFYYYEDIDPSNYYVEKAYPFKYTAQKIGIGYKQYFSGIAPLGSFWGISLNNYLINTYMVDTQLNQNKYKNSGYDLGLGVHFGWDYLFWNRLRVSWAVTAQINYGTLRASNAAVELREMEGHFDMSEKKTQILKASYLINNSHWFGFSVGLGFLAF